MLLFESNEHRVSHKRYFPPTLETKDFNVMIDGRFFDQPISNDIKIYENKITTGEGDDHTAGFLIDYPYFKRNKEL